MTANLYYALWQLCKRSLNTYWWIDTLCINQASNLERTAQVSIMHLIFRDASTVYVWLGPDPSGEVYTVREFYRAPLAKYVDRDLDVGGPGKYVVDWLDRFEEQISIAAGLPPVDQTVWKPVIRFWDRAWFHHAWVKQEVALTGRVQIWCGCAEFTLKELIEVSRFHVWSGLDQGSLHLHLDTLTKSTGFRKFGSSAVQFKDLKLFLEHSNDFKEAQDFRQAADRLCGPKVKGQHPLLRIFAIQIFLARRADATDSRDKVSLYSY